MIVSAPGNPNQSLSYYNNSPVPDGLVEFKYIYFLLNHEYKGKYEHSLPGIKNNIKKNIHWEIPPVL
jgi:hypothetical protein